MKPTAIVTGVDSGIGRASAKAFLEQDYNVGMTYFHDEQDHVEELVEELEATGCRAEMRHMDLINTTAAVTIVEELIDDLGGVDVMINNAGTDTSLHL